MSVPEVSSFSADSSPVALLVLPKASAGPHPLLEWEDSLHKKATNQTEYRPGGVGPVSSRRGAMNLCLLIV